MGVAGNRRRKAAADCTYERVGGRPELLEVTGGIKHQESHYSALIRSPLFVEVELRVYILNFWIRK